jgi:hypothetical protein
MYGHVMILVVKLKKLGCRGARFKSFVAGEDEWNELLILR